MGVGFEHEVKESMSKSVETRVESGIGNIVGGMSGGEAKELGSGVRDGGYSGQRGVVTLE